MIKLKTTWNSEAPVLDSLSTAKGTPLRDLSRFHDHCRRRSDDDADDHGGEGRSEYAPQGPHR